MWARRDSTSSVHQSERSCTAHSAPRRSVTSKWVAGTVAALVGCTISASGTATASSPPPIYPLGGAPSCLPGYVKSIRTHIVNGKSVRYVACVRSTPSLERARPTKTILTMSQEPVGSSKSPGITDVQDWQASVTAVGAALSPAPGQVRFVLSLGKRVLATFVGTAANPTECSFTDVVTGTDVTIQTTGPDRCQGGVAGYVVLRSPEVRSPDIAVRAVFIGTKLFLHSASGPVNPENVPAGNPVRSS